MSAEPPPSLRTVHQGDALAWLRAHAPLISASVITSLPDLSEVPQLGFEGWKGWFQEAAAVTMAAVADDGLAIFFQSDIRQNGLWVDKGALVAQAAERARMNLLFHKIVCRKPPGTLTYGRATYAHLLGYARSPRPAPTRPTADVLPDGGFKPGTKAMGVNACLAACRYVMDVTTTRLIVDPFCGFGTVLAVANALGLDAIGVDLSPRMCRQARTLRIDLEPRSVEAAR